MEPAAQPNSGSAGHPVASVPRLRMESVRKSFGATLALRGVSLNVAPGEVHALIGENGAGKSTLMKVLSGACQPDEGVIELDGRPFVPEDPLNAKARGIAMIYQELTLAPHLSVEENILLGSEPSTLGWIDRSRRRELARNALAELHHDHIPLQIPVGRLTIGEQQIVEIARALLGSPRLIILDEPTSSLSQVDARDLFSVIRKLKSRGVSLIYISHFLEECIELCDRYTVLRDGESVASGLMGEARVETIIRQMAGREIAEIYPRIAHDLGQTVMTLRKVAGVTKPKSADLVLREGEILGIAGLVGAGRTETLRTVFGLDKLVSGEVAVFGRPDAVRSPGASLRDGVGLLSENRKEEGLMLGRDLADNLTLTCFEPVSRFGFVDRKRQLQCTEGWMEKLSVKARSAGQRIGELSGGNQQKIAIGRLLHHDARIFLLDEPTRGIDVGSKSQIYRLIMELAGRGKSVIFVSSHLPELMGVCDSIAVMCRGVLAETRPVADWSEHALMSALVGAQALELNDCEGRTAGGVA